MLHASFLHIGKLLCPRLADCACPASLYPFVSTKCLLEAESAQKWGNLRQTLENKSVSVIVVALLCDVVDWHNNGLCWDRSPSGCNCLPLRASIVKYVETCKTLVTCMRVSVALSTHCCYLFSSIQLARSMIVSTKWCILLAVVKCTVPDGWVVKGHKFGQCHAVPFSIICYKSCISKLVF